MGARRVAGVMVAAVLAASLAGCSSAPVDCGAPNAIVPLTAHAGASITLLVDGLYRDCQAEEQRLGAVVTVGKITVTLQSDDGEVVASTTVPFDDSAKATAVLEIPATASGSYNVMADSNLLGAVDVTAASD